MFQAVVHQFMRPNGRKVIKYVDLPEDFKEKYEDMKKAGCRLTAEVLTTGEVSVCVENDEADLDIRVVDNNEYAPTEALMSMLNSEGWKVAS